MEKILLAYGLPKETIVAIMMLYKNMKVKVHSPERDTDYLDIIAGLLQGDTLAPYLFMICLDYELRMFIDIMKDNGFKLSKKKIPRTNNYGQNYADDIVFLANIPTQVETLLHSLERAVVCIGLHVYTDKTEYMCFNQRGNISTLNGSSLKVVVKFFYQGSSVSSTETDINVRLAKA